MKVLLATDGSAAAETALELAASITWPAESTIRLVSVIEPVETILSGAWTPALSQDIEDQVDELLASADVVLEHAARQLAGSGATIEREVMRGRAGSCVVEDATRFGADLIIIGSRGHGSIGSMLLGSVSAEVADHAPCPVLVARTPRLTRIILGTDGSQYAFAAEQWLRRWPIFSQAAIEVTSVAYLGMPWTSGLALSAYTGSGEDYADTGRQIIADHRQTAETAAERLSSAGLRATARVAEGDAAQELIRIAADDQADMIVLGTHGRTGLARLIMGSVARNVMLHAHCSVLIVRATEEEAAKS
jgi:nucleotide-binding universal stress UspA family protein